jgi:DNA-binding MarR family transcriptional regulator
MSVSKEDLRAWLSVVRAYQLCNDALIEKLKPLGLKLPQYEVLVRLLHEPTQTQQQLALHSFVVKSHMSGLLSDMLERGWIKRSENDQDKRSKVISLTTKGAALAKKAAFVQNEVVGVMLAAMSKKQIIEVEQVMTSVAQALKNYHH